MIQQPRPTIFQVGQVTPQPDGTTWIGGWGLGSCVHNCPCHRDPATNALTLSEDSSAGLLGLRHWFPCNCCRGWTAAELAVIVADLADVSALPTLPSPEAMS